MAGGQKTKMNQQEQTKGITDKSGVLFRGKPFETG